MMLFEVFLNAWKIAVTLYHNKNMEYCNNPTPEVIYALNERRARCLALKEWGMSRWGDERICCALQKLE